MECMGVDKTLLGQLNVYSMTLISDLVTLTFDLVHHAYVNIVHVLPHTAISVQQTIEFTNDCNI